MKVDSFSFIHSTLLIFGVKIYITEKKEKETLTLTLYLVMIRNGLIYSNKSKAITVDLLK